MEYTYDDIEKIVGFKSWSEKRKIDELLRIDCDMYTNMGSDSSKKDRLETKKKSRSIYRLIQKLNPETGKSFLYHMDS